MRDAEVRRRLGAASFVELSEAEAFAEALGFPAPPQPEPEETGNAQLNNTKGFD